MCIRDSGNSAENRNTDALFGFNRAVYFTAGEIFDGNAEIIGDTFNGSGVRRCV